MQDVGRMQAAVIGHVPPVAQLQRPREAQQHREGDGEPPRQPTLLEDAVDDAAQGAPIGQLSHAEDVQPPLIEAAQLLFQQLLLLSADPKAGDGVGGGAAAPLPFGGGAVGDPRPTAGPGRRRR